MNKIFSIMVVFLCAPVFLFVTPSVAAAPQASDMMTDAVSGMQFIWVAKGCFTPASISAMHTQAVKTTLTKQQPSSHQLISFDVLDAETPVATIHHDEPKTCLKKGFWMAIHEVTQGQYQQLMGTNPSSFNKGDDYPVENVRWLEARAFIRKLNAASGKTFRLPSEAEWEFAARAGRAQTQLSSDYFDDVAWYLPNSNSSTHPVGQKKANALGLYDMHGNVWEWTQDCWNEDMQAAPTDGSAWLQGQCGARVLRGGSWYDDQSMLSNTARVYNDSDSADNNSGFRIVLD